MDPNQTNHQFKKGDPRKQGPSPFFVVIGDIDVQISKVLKYVFHLLYCRFFF